MFLRSSLELRILALLLSSESEAGFESSYNIVFALCLTILPRFNSMYRLSPVSSAADSFEAFPVVTRNDVIGSSLTEPLLSSFL